MTEQTPEVLRRFDLIKEFKNDALLRYFDMSKPIYVFSEAHISGLGAMLGQRDNVKSIKPVAIASRTKRKAEASHRPGNNGSGFWIKALQKLSGWSLKHNQTDHRSQTTSSSIQWERKGFNKI